MMAQYGDRLVCVRYRYDAHRQKRVKTVELIVDEADWEPRQTLSADQIVGVRVEVQEYDVQKRIREAGGTWNRQRKVWELRDDRVLELGLQDRLVKESGEA